MLLLYVAETASAKQGWTTIPWTLTRRLSEAFTRYDTIYGTPLNLPATAELRNSYLPSQLECLSKQSRLTSYIVEMYTYHMRGHQLFRSATISSHKLTPPIYNSPNCNTRILSLEALVLPPLQSSIQRFRAATRCQDSEVAN